MRIIAVLMATQLSGITQNRLQRQVSTPGSLLSPDLTKGTENGAGVEEMASGRKNHLFSKKQSLHTRSSCVVLDVHVATEPERILGKGLEPAPAQRRPFSPHSVGLTWKPGRSGETGSWHSLTVSAAEH